MGGKIKHIKFLEKDSWTWDELTKSIALQRKRKHFYRKGAKGRRCSHCVIEDYENKVSLTLRTGAEDIVYYVFSIASFQVFWRW